MFFPIFGNSQNRWNHQIPYKISQNINDTKNILNAMNYISSVTIVSFIEQTNEIDFIEFDKLDGCFSNVGRIGGKQIISIGDGCNHIGVITHEISHAIGLNHEQSHYNRDNYIKINNENIIKDVKNNFKKSNYKQNEIEYDYGSIMHYELWAFSSNGQKTIDLLHDTNVCFIGQIFELSKNDIKLINNLVDFPINMKIKETTEYQENNNIYFCGGRNFQTYSFIFSEYEKVDNYYRSKWTYYNEYSYIFYNNTHWEITFNNLLYGYSNDLTSSWSLLNMGTNNYEVDTSSNIQNLEGSRRLVSKTQLVIINDDINVLLISLIIALIIIVIMFAFIIYKFCKKTNDIVIDDTITDATIEVVNNNL